MNYKQERKESADSANVQADDLQNLTETSLSKDTSLKIFMEIWCFSRDIIQTVEKFLIL